jgi:hypothetical protein
MLRAPSCLAQQVFCAGLLLLQPLSKAALLAAPHDAAMQLQVVCLGHTEH